MREGFIGALLLASMLALNAGGALAQQAEPDNCQNLAPVPGQGREYDLFKNLSGARAGCAGPSQVVYQKADGRAVPSQTEEVDRAACKNQGEHAATAARGLQPGEYDIFKSTFASQSGDADKYEQSCMTERGYKSVGK